MEKINELSFKRLECISRIMDERTELNELLDQTRALISKAKTIHGVTLSNVAQADTRDLNPTSRVHVSNDKTPIFTFMDDLEEQTSEVKKSNDEKKEKIRNRKQASPNEQDNQEDEKEEKKTVQLPSFRPFGVLEPVSAKDARKTMRNALAIICHLASSQAELCQLEVEMEQQKSSVEKSKQIVDILQALKI